MGNSNKFNDLNEFGDSYYKNPDELESYGHHGYLSDYRKIIDEKNSRKVMLSQFELIKEQRREIIENRKKSKRLFIISILGNIIALASLMVAIFK